MLLISVPEGEIKASDHGQNSCLVCCFVKPWTKYLSSHSRQGRRHPFLPSSRAPAVRSPTARAAWTSPTGHASLISMGCLGSAGLLFFRRDLGRCVAPTGGRIRALRGCVCPVTNQQYNALAQTSWAISLHGMMQVLQPFVQGQGRYAGHCCCNADLHYEASLYLVALFCGVASIDMLMCEVSCCAQKHCQESFAWHLFTICRLELLLVLKLFIQMSIGPAPPLLPYPLSPNNTRCYPIVCLVIIQGCHNGSLLHDAITEAKYHDLLWSVVPTIS